MIRATRLEFRKMRRLRTLPILTILVVAVAALSSISLFAGSTRETFDGREERIGDSFGLGRERERLG